MTVVFAPETDQEAFDAAVAHIATMRERARDMSGCVYLGPDGERCPIGALLEGPDDELIDLGARGIGASLLPCIAGVATHGINLVMLDRLQLCHDEPNHWDPEAGFARWELLYDLADDYGLAADILVALGHHR